MVSALEMMGERSRSEEQNTPTCGGEYPNDGSFAVPFVRRDVAQKEPGGRMDGPDVLRKFNGNDVSVRGVVDVCWVVWAPRKLAFEELGNRQRPVEGRRREGGTVRALGVHSGRRLGRARSGLGRGV